MWMREESYRASDQMSYTTKNGLVKKIVTVGDKWATFQSENFNKVSQPQYAIIHPDEKVFTKTKVVHAIC